MLNNVVLIGRLTADPEVKEISKESKVARFTLAVGRRYKNSEGEYEADFIRCNAWNQLADLIGQYTKQGDQIAIEGELQTSSYVDEKEVTRYVTDVRVSNVTFLAKKKSDADGE
mgnify:CR=1 FL=1